MDDLSNQTQFRLEKINKIKDYFIAELREREQISKKHHIKYIVACDYFDKILIVSSATSGGVSIFFFFTTFIGAHAHVEILSTSFSLAFSLNTGIIKKLLRITTNKKKNIIRFLC